MVVAEKKSPHSIYSWDIVVNDYGGGRKNYLIPSIFEMLSQTIILGMLFIVVQVLIAGSAGRLDI